jgi:chromosome partitioning protein
MPSDSDLHIWDAPAGNIDSIGLTQPAYSKNQADRLCSIYYINRLRKSYQSFLGEDYIMTFENFQDFEKVVAILLSNEGWSVALPPANTKGYDITATKNSEVVAVQVKNFKAPIKTPQLDKFLDFLELDIAQKFTQGFFVTSSSYSKAALTYFDSLQTNRVGLLVVDEAGQLKWVRRPGQSPDAESTDLATSVENPPEPVYFGVFTCKGGVGKTTVSAHLSGALALSGYDVALIDLDPEKNLSTLLGEGIKLPRTDEQPGQTITIYNESDWDYDHPPDEKMIVCDCSPSLERNPEKLIRQLSYCVIPTTLNPLGLNKNGHVIRETLKAIRRVNRTAHLFVLINNYFADESEKSDVLKEIYRDFFSQLAQEDERFHFIDPDEVAIRNSKQLFYWGYHLYAGGKHQLAFNAVGGRCHPKADFLNLLSYLEEHSDLTKLKSA